MLSFPPDCEWGGAGNAVADDYAAYQNLKRRAFSMLCGSFCPVPVNKGKWQHVEGDAEKFPLLTQFPMESDVVFKLRWQYFKAGKDIHRRSCKHDPYKRERLTLTRNWHNFGTKNNPVQPCVANRARLYRVRIEYADKTCSEWVYFWICGRTQHLKLLT